MDVFAFASQSETQGMVLAEAMAAGVPVVAVDAPGVREMVVDGRNGRLLSTEQTETFSSALGWVASLSSNRRKRLSQAAKETGAQFSSTRSTVLALNRYQSLLGQGHGQKHVEGTLWLSALSLIETEWDLWSNRAHAARVALTGARGQEGGS